MPQLIPLIEDEQEHLRLPAAYGGERAATSWPVRAGFHAVPSMETVHLHVSLAYRVGRSETKLIRRIYPGYQR